MRRRRTHLKCDQTGQALLEFSILLPVLIGLVIGAGWVLHSEYQRTRCAHLAFEQTHAAMQGQFHLPRLDVQIDEQDEHWVGVARCGKIRERVALRKLEAIRW